MIIFGRSVEKNFENCLSLINSAGFRYVEVGNIIHRYNTIDDIKYILKKYDITISAYHVGINYLEDSIKLNDILNKARCLCVKNIICSGILNGSSNNINYEMTAELLNKNSELLNKQGIKLHYHFHNWEFEYNYNGYYGAIYLYNNTNNSINFILDTYWLKKADIIFNDVWPLVTERSSIIHFKDGKPSKEDDVFTPLGQGDINLINISNTLIQSSNLDYIVWEQDHPVDSIESSITTSYNWLNSNIRKKS